MQRYLERGDVIRPKVTTTATSECAGRRSKVKTDNLFAATTERLCKKFRPSLTSLSGGETVGSVECESRHINLTSGNTVFR